MQDQHLETLTRTMLRAWAGEPLPDVDSPEYDALQAALVNLPAAPADLALFGAASARALLHFWRHGLEAQRSVLLAQRSSRRPH